MHRAQGQDKPDADASGTGADEKWRRKMELSEMLNLIFGGGLIATLVALLTIKQTMQKAKAEAERAKADAETVRIDNAEHATRILIENIVEPLKKELNATRREMARLRKALDHANACEYHSTCPVLYELRDQPKGHGGVGTEGRGGDIGKSGQYVEDGMDCRNAAYPDVGGRDEHPYRQPP